MSGFEPKIVGFQCNWCSYAGADKAGAAQLAYPPNARIVRVMCSGRVDPQLVVEAYRRAAQRHRLLLRVLRQLGIDEARCRFDSVSAGEGEKFARVVSEMVEEMRSLGPLRHGSSGSLCERRYVDDSADAVPPAVVAQNLR